MLISSKLPDVGTTIFSVMSKMAEDHGAINLSQGYPDFSVPEALLERLNHYAESGYNQYPPMHGISYLREQITQKVAACYHAIYDSETEVTVVSGATEGLFVAIQSVVRPNDEIIVFDPAYDAYDPAIRLAGGKAVHLQLAAPSFEIDWQKVADAITPRTRAIIINSPHNPTGAVITSDDLKQLERLIESTPIYIISDEVYEHMTFDGRAHQSLSRHSALRERAFVISSFGKTYHATGWKVGYCLAPEALSLEFRKIHQFVTFTTHTPSQWAIADFLENYPEHHEKLSAFYEKKRDLFIDAIADLEFSLSPSGGTYFQLAGYDELSKEPDQSFVNALTKEAGVAAIPVSVFYESPPEQNFIRFCFAKEDKTLLQAAEKLRKYFS